MLKQMLFYEHNCTTMVTYATKYAVDIPHEQTVHRISNANKQTDCMEIILNKVCYPY